MFTHLGDSLILFIILKIMCWKTNNSLKSDCCPVYFHEGKGAMKQEEVTLRVPQSRASPPHRGWGITPRSTARGGSPRQQAHSANSTTPDSHRRVLEKQQPPHLPRGLSSPGPGPSPAGGGPRGPGCVRVAVTPGCWHCARLTAEGAELICFKRILRSTSILLRKVSFYKY